MTSPWVDGEQLTAAKMYARITVPLGTLAQGTPQPVSLASGFTGTVTAVKISGSLVFMAGAVTRTAGNFPNSATTVGTLPAGFRPSAFLRVALAGIGSGTANGAHLQIGTGSDDVIVTGVGCTTSTVYLSGICWSL